MARMTEDDTLVEFTVKGMPVGKQRARVTRHGYAYTPKKTVDYEDDIKAAAKSAGVTECTRCHISVRVYLPTKRKQFKRKPTEHSEPLLRADLDNIVKCVLDALDGVAYRNDRHVLGVGARFYFITRKSATPYIEVDVRGAKWEEYRDDSKEERR